MINEICIVINIHIGEESFVIDIEEGTFVCAFVASSKETVKFSKDKFNIQDSKFPQGFVFPNENQHHNLVMPVSQSDGKLAGVLELYRKEEKGEFHDEAKKVNSYLAWGQIALHYSELNYSMMEQRNLHEFLLSVVRSLFQDMESIDNLIETIVNYARELVKADRASLFLLDDKKQYLLAKIFDVGANSETGNEEVKDTFKRLQIGQGIAGTVAETGECLNIEDAYSDSRFCQDIDEITKYKTNSILCVPIIIREEVIGAQLYDTIYKSEQSYKLWRFSVTTIRAPRRSSNPLKIKRYLIIFQEVDKFSFNSLELKEKMVPHMLYMFKDLFGVRNFDKDSLIRFFFTVRKNYRGVPYHNWKHGFCVANSMYVIIKGSPCVFYNLEEGHNIFGKLKPSDYKKVLDNMKHCILATDLKNFFKNKGIIKELIDEKSFDSGDLEHRLLLQALTMTSCDISASAKPWKIHVGFATEIIEEFYTQGDKEKRAGKIPIPMMDRDKPEQQVPSQIGFISGICIPCYELIEKLIPASAPLLQESKKNLELYKSMKKSQLKESERGKSVQGLGKQTSEKTSVSEGLARAVALPLFIAGVPAPKGGADEEK
ncbi:cGMP-specific 3',5'-cyclic phosphodiesterase [Armadillidium nasatum]|uniref:3',5'-cyclic-GMP phosphodiesterase n=1 Tax=Armadillidium nasatum TaxID=96803 RepID=A0A5N5SM61_9CRUS|nr:cGMP-specific 3',5'-cyclic phosphodiesterase [Armadillidium nasatum]